MGIGQEAQSAVALRIGFLGAGRMATAMAAGFVRAGLARPEDLAASDPSPAARQQFAEATGAAAGEDNRAVAARSSVVILAVKPQNMAELLAELRGSLTTEHLVASIAAGIRLEQLRAGLGPAPRLVRVMPNAPCLVGCGASGFALDAGALPADRETVQSLLTATGRAVETPETLLDAVTGLSGSGPAFIFLVIEALADGGVAAGLPRAVALELAAQTVRGAAEMVLATGRHPGELKDTVASPGGTTIAGLAALESRGLRGALIEAVLAASRRAAELATNDPSPPDAGRASEEER